MKKSLFSILISLFVLIGMDAQILGEPTNLEGAKIGVPKTTTSLMCFMPTDAGYNGVFILVDAKGNAWQQKIDGSVKNLNKKANVLDPEAITGERVPVSKTSAKTILASNGKLYLIGTKGDIWRQEFDGSSLSSPIKLSGAKVGVSPTAAISMQIVGNVIISFGAKNNIWTQLIDSDGKVGDAVALSNLSNAQMKLQTSALREGFPFYYIYDMPKKPDNTKFEYRLITTKGDLLYQISDTGSGWEYFDVLEAPPSVTKLLADKSNKILGMTNFGGLFIITAKGQVINIAFDYAG